MAILNIQVKLQVYLVLPFMRIHIFCMLFAVQYYWNYKTQELFLDKLSAMLTTMIDATQSCKQKYVLIICIKSL